MRSLKDPRVQQLRDLYREIADMTHGECAGENRGCALPFSCCSRMHCEMTQNWALERYGVALAETSHPSIPLLGSNGCTVEPYLRPICSVHACCINSLGLKMKGLGAQEWTKKYFELREQIEDLECDLESCPDGGFDEVFDAMEQT